jgi:hypothetical protein
MLKLTIVNVPLARMLGLATLAASIYGGLFVALIASGAISARSLTAALVILAAVIACSAVTVAAVEAIREHQPRRLSSPRTPDADPALELVSLCMVVCALVLGLAAFDHPSTWTYRAVSAAQVTR